MQRRSFTHLSFPPSWELCCGRTRGCGLQACGFDIFSAGFFFPIKTWTFSPSYGHVIGSVAVPQVATPVASELLSRYVSATQGRHARCYWYLYNNLNQTNLLLSAPPNCSDAIPRRLPSRFLPTRHRHTLLKVSSPLEVPIILGQTQRIACKFDSVSS